MEKGKEKYSGKSSEHLIRMLEASLSGLDEGKPILRKKVLDLVNNNEEGNFDDLSKKEKTIMSKLSEMGQFLGIE